MCQSDICVCVCQSDTCVCACVWPLLSMCHSLFVSGLDRDTATLQLQGVTSKLARQSWASCGCANTLEIAEWAGCMALLSHSHTV